MVFLVKRMGFVYRRVNANHHHHYYHHGRSWKAMNYDNDNSQVGNWWQYAAPVKPDADAACAGANLRSSSNSSGTMSPSFSSSNSSERQFPTSSSLLDTSTWEGAIEGISPVLDDPPERSFEWTHESCTLLSCHCIRQKIPFVRQVPGCRCTWYWRQWIMTMTIRKWVIDDNMQLRVDGQVKNDNSQSAKMQHMMEPFVVLRLNCFLAWLPPHGVATVSVMEVAHVTEVTCNHLAG